MASRQQPLRRTVKSTDAGVDTSRSPTPVSGYADADDAGECNVDHDLVSVLYHALRGVETYSNYARDARRDGDRELVEFFEDCRDDDAERAERARQLLADRWQDTKEDEEDDATGEAQVERKLDDAWSDY
jgi:hypothetical protein